MRHTPIDPALFIAHRRQLLELLPKDNSIYRRMMERDVIQESWTNRNRLDLILKELKDSLYY